MANEEQLAILSQGVDVWNKWRDDNPGIRPDLERADLMNASLPYINFDWTELTEARLMGANLQGAHIHNSNLCSVRLQNANLSESSVFSTHL